MILLKNLMTIFSCTLLGVAIPLVLVFLTFFMFEVFTSMISTYGFMISTYGFEWVISISVLIVGGLFGLLFGVAIVLTEEDSDEW